MITTRFAGQIIPHEGSIEAQALALLTKLVNGYGLEDDPPAHEMDPAKCPIEARVEIHLTSDSAHGLFMPANPATRHEVSLKVADRLRLNASGMDDITLADEIDMALVRVYRRLVQHVQSLTIVIPARQAQPFWAAA